MTLSSFSHVTSVTCDGLQRFINKDSLYLVFKDQLFIACAPYPGAEDLDALDAASLLRSLKENIERQRHKI